MAKMKPSPVLAHLPRCPSLVAKRSLVRSISYVYGKNDRDPYQSITTQPEEMTTKLAGVLEMRVADKGQQALRTKLLAGISGHVLEVGTGTGAVAREIARLPGVERVTGVDPSPAFLRKAREVGGANEHYVEGSSTSLDVSSGSIDHCVLWTTLCHIPQADHSATFGEILRTLRPGGTLHIFDNDPSGWDFRMHAHDPLHAPLNFFLDMGFPDRYLLRRAPLGLADAGFEVGPLRLHTILDTTADSYGYQFVLLRSIDTFASFGVVGAPMIAALRDEAARRVTTGEFQMALSYAHICATKPW